MLLLIPNISLGQLPDDLCKGHNTAYEEGEKFSTNKNYFFLEQNEKKQLVIDANMDIDSITVMVVSKSEGNSHYLIHKNELYPLNIDATETTSLEQIDFTKNNETRMFMDRPSFPIGVYQIIF